MKDTRLHLTFNPYFWLALVIIGLAMQKCAPRPTATAQPTSKPKFKDVQNEPESEQMERLYYYDSLNSFY